MRLIIKLGLSLLLLLPFLSAQADSSLTARKSVQIFIQDMVKNHKFKKSELEALFNQVQLQPKIIESITKPYEKKNWDIYKALFLTPQRLQEGVAFWEKNQVALDKAEKKFGVPAQIIVSILGVETFYGKHQGNYRVVDALSTLAFDYPPRSPFFTKELREYLLLCRELKTPATQHYGSYAGAIGKPQFMPSSYRFYAVDFTGNGEKDLVNNDSDAIGSIANYLHKHGWKKHDLVAQPATIKGNNYKNIQKNAKFANYPVKKLVASGIKPASSTWRQPVKAGLIELFTKTGNEYWVAYPNFFVITRYNSSPQYALVVYLLAQQLKLQKTQTAKNRFNAYV